MGNDIVSQLLIHDIEAVYRPQAVAANDPANIVKRNSQIKYDEILAGNTRKGRIFDLDEDHLKKYRERDDYVIDPRDLFTKYPLKVGDIIIIRDEVRVNAYYVKSNEFLSLEPYVKLFKIYSCMVIEFQGEILLANDTKLKFPTSYFGIDQELP